jgi:ATP-binding cassette subfamily B protein
VVRFAAGYWKQQPVNLTIILALFVSAAFIETYLPTALSNFLVAIREQAGKEAIIRDLAVFLIVYALQTTLFALTFVFYNSFETKIFKSLMDDAFQHIFRLPEHFFVNTFSGSIISKINRARQKIEAFEDHIFIRIIPTLVVLTGSTVFLWFRFPLLALLMVLYVITLLVISTIIVFKISGPAQAIYADAQDHFIAHLADCIGGVATTKAYAQEKVEVKKFFALTSWLRKKNLLAYIYGNLAGLIQRLLLFGMLALLLGGGLFYHFQGKANIEDMAYLAFAYTILQSYMRDLGDNVKNLLTSSYDLHGIILLLRNAPEVNNDEASPALQIEKGKIVFENVSFAYPGKSAPVFQNLSVSIRAGERIALVGHSGSGKTTFIRLLQCAYVPQSGRILIDGQDIKEGSRASLRSAMALVPQDPILFHRTLRENIAYGRPDAGQEEIEAAACRAHISDFIESLPLKYETLVGERGIKLSGGERQRIAIARSMVADRPILILDEATSSLDSASERAIQDALHSLTQGRTSIIIAHRLSTVLDSDRILVFEHGCIAEEGTHAELLDKANGIYAGFFKLQTGVFLTD